MTTQTMPLEERYVRCCPMHDVPVEERGSALICPKGGGHAVAKFKVVDRLKRTAELVPVDGDQRRGGLEMVEKNAPAAVRPTAPTPAPAPAPAKKTPPLEVILRTKFRDELGNVLWVRLVKETRKRDGVVYIVRWALQEHGSFKAKTRPLAASAFQEAARKSYDEQLELAQKAGWTPVPTSGRELTFVPLPSPAKKKRS